MRTIGTPSTQARKLNAIASGALPNGDPVVVNSDGTVSVVSESAIPQEIGSASIFESGSTTFTDSVYESNAQKVVISYRDGGNSNYGTAVVGTVSGTSISFGTPVVFESASTVYTSATFDSNADKVVIAYKDQGNSNAGTAIVGTVSGTAISFGSAAVFYSVSSSHMSTAFDSNSNKVVIAYQDNGNSDHGYAIVGTVSGTNISFGSAVVFESAAIGGSSVVFDSNSSKVVIAYSDLGNSSYGTAIVGTVSGSSISFGSATVFESAQSEHIACTYDSENQKVIVCYSDRGNADYGTAIVGTVSGTSISFGSAVVFSSSDSEVISATYDVSARKVVIAYKDRGNSEYGTVVAGTVSGASISFASPAVFESATSIYISATYDANAEKVVIAYTDDGNSAYGTALVFKPAYTSTNLTSENYIGLASNGYPDTAGATIDVQGAINDRQSGLTAGQSYYVQTDGTLTTTAGSPSVFAGTAISATKMIVKG